MAAIYGEMDVSARGAAKVGMPTILQKMTTSSYRSIPLRSEATVARIVSAIVLDEYGVN